MNAASLLLTTQRVPCSAVQIGSGDSATVEAMIRMIQQAVALVEGGKQPGIQRIAKVIGVPHSVLYAHVNGIRSRQNAPYPLLYTLHSLATAPAPTVAEAFRLANRKRKIRFPLIKDASQEVNA